MAICAFWIHFFASVASRDSRFTPMRMSELGDGALQLRVLPPSEARILKTHCVAEPASLDQAREGGSTTLTPPPLIAQARSLWIQTQKVSHSTTMTANQCVHMMNSTATAMIPMRQAAMTAF